MQEEIQDTEQVEPLETSSTTSDSTMSIKQTDQIVVGGKKGSGKTNLTKTIVSWLLSSGCPVVIVDPLLEYREFANKGAIIKYIQYGNVAQFNQFLKPLFNTFKGFLIIDEADGFFPNKINLLTPSKTLIHLGRHYGIGSMYVTRRLSNLHTDVISQTGKLFLFRLYAGADAQYLERAQLGEIVDPVFNLEKYQFVSYDADTATIQINTPIPLFM